jgi:hypothetical protein
MLFFMQRRLLNFFEAVRNESPQWQSCFMLITRDDGLWTEARFIRHGLPVNWLCLIEAHASCSFQMKCATGFFAAHRTVNPRKAALNIVRESQALVADVRIEFAGRQREQRQG